MKDTKMPGVRVLVVEDSLTVRKRLCEVLSADDGIEVIGEAADGRQAVDMCMALRPDVVTMDMMLPVMNGLAATEHIMAHCPTPILVVSACQRNELFRTFDALAAGALEVLEKPSGDEDDGDWARRLVSSVKLVSRVRVITHLKAKLSHKQLAAHIPQQAEPCKPLQKTRLIALGSSTGGPGALVKILKALPAPLKVPVLIVQHIGDDFGVAFADWLAGQSRHPVRYARDREALEGTVGTVILAPPGRHLLLNEDRLVWFDGPPLHSCKPAIDHLFSAISRSSLAACTTACLLTGMGRDGASGLLDIRRAGGHTVAQDEASSVIYGMPKEAVKIGAAQQVLCLDEIGPMLADTLKNMRGTTR
jgi:two-component system chemotaxis response regulator CheB